MSDELKEINEKIEILFMGLNNLRNTIQEMKVEDEHKFKAYQLVKERVLRLEKENISLKYILQQNYVMYNKQNIETIRAALDELGSDVIKDIITQSNITIN